MKRLPFLLGVIAVMASPAWAHPFPDRYAVRAVCSRSGVIGVGADVTVAAAAAAAVAQCRAGGGSARCCRRDVRLWRLL